MPSHRWGAKDPDEVVSYTHDWAAVLVDGDEVVGQPEAVVESCDAVVDLSVMKTATVQRVRVSGGTPGRCKITIGIHTVLGNYWQEGIILPIREQ